MALLKNGTISSSNTATTGYNFPSSSFTHQSKPNMPSDQKAKLLAMHRDGKANAGMYVAVVLIVYFILVIILLCRYGKRRPRPSEPTPALDSAAEQGRLHRLNCHLGKLISCGGDADGCLGCLGSACVGRCHRTEASSVSKPVFLSDASESDKPLGKSVSKENDTSLQKKVGINLDKDNERGKSQNGRHTDLSDMIQKCSPEDEQQNEDSEESLEDD